METQFVIPNPGSKVAITFAFSSYVLGSPKFVKSTVTGIVEKATRFTPPNFVRILTDFDSPVRIREIPLERILDIQYSNGYQATKEQIINDTKTWTVQGSRGSQYLVVQTKNNWSCTCPGFNFRKMCKHVENLKKN
jgi:hypothetical protein